MLPIEKSKEINTNGTQIHISSKQISDTLGSIIAGSNCRSLLFFIPIGSLTSGSLEFSFPVVVTAVMFAVVVVVVDVANFFFPSFFFLTFLGSAVGDEEAVVVGVVVADFGFVVLVGVDDAVGEDEDVVEVDEVADATEAVDETAVFVVVVVVAEAVDDDEVDTVAEGWQ